jgi:hypothetical protein
MKLTLATLWIVLITLVSGCGSGGGISGTGVIQTTDDVTFGMINGFGSVIVNQRRLESDSAEIIVNGVTTDESDLYVGMQVQVRANLDTQVAQRIEYVPLVIGPVDSFDPVAGALDVFGHDVLITSSTVFEGVGEGVIPVNTVVEVSGFTNARRQIAATFIRAVPNAVEYQLLATINSTNTNFEVNVDLASLDLLLDSMDPEFELLAELGEFDRFPSRQAVLTLPADNSTLLTPSLSFLVPREPFAQGARASILQSVLDTLPDGSFRTESFTINTSAQTVFIFEGGALATPADVTPNAIVNITGDILSADGFISAEMVEILN